MVEKILEIKGQHIVQKRLLEAWVSFTRNLSKTESEVIYGVKMVKSVLHLKQTDMYSYFSCHTLVSSLNQSPKEWLPDLHRVNQHCNKSWHVQKFFG